MESKKVIKYVLISGIGHTIVMIMAVAAGAFLSNALFFGSLVLFVLLQWWVCGQDYKRGYEDGKKPAGYALSEIDTCFDQREREMRLSIQKDLKDRGIEVDLIGENGLIKKKRKYYGRSMSNFSNFKKIIWLSSFLLILTGCDEKWLEKPKVDPIKDCIYSERYYHSNTGELATCSPRNNTVMYPKIDLFLRHCVCDYNKVNCDKEYSDMKKYQEMLLKNCPSHQSVTAKKL